MWKTISIGFLLLLGIISSSVGIASASECSYTQKWFTNLDSAEENSVNGLPSVGFYSNTAVTITLNNCNRPMHFIVNVFYDKKIESANFTIPGPSGEKYLSFNGYMDKGFVNRDSRMPIVDIAAVSD